jgi:hypothetical protein
MRNDAQLCSSAIVVGMKNRPIALLQPIAGIDRASLFIAMQSSSVNKGRSAAAILSAA